MSKTIKFKAPRKKQRDHLIKTGISKRGTGIHKNPRDKRKANKTRKLIEEQYD